MLNSLTENPEFQSTNLYQVFKNKALGFIDVGALGEVHPLVAPVAALTHVICFEPQQAEYDALVKKYATQSPFAKTSIHPTAIAGKISDGEVLYITDHSNNSSLIKPNQSLINRYHMEGFKIKKNVSVPTKTLDNIIEEATLPRMGEFLKLDAQGSAYDILQGADQLLRESCLGIFTEAEFCKIYENQKTHSDIEHLLREYGFFMYGLYPNYRSNKVLDGRKQITQERIFWADTLYFKDPLDEHNTQRSFADRDIQVLILIAILTQFYDFSLELVKNYFNESKERLLIEKLINTLAQNDKHYFLEAFKKICPHFDTNDETAYVQLRKFIDQHRFHSNLDYLPVAESQ